MTTLRGRVYDRASGRSLEARVGVLASMGQFCAPSDAIHKVGNGEPYFYSDGTFEVDVPIGQTDVFVEQIDQAVTWLTTRARFDHLGQRDRTLQLFAAGRAWFERGQA